MVLWCLSIKTTKVKLNKKVYLKMYIFFKKQKLIKMMKHNKIFKTLKLKQEDNKKINKNMYVNTTKK